MIAARIVERQDPVRHTPLAGEIRELCLVSPGDDEIKPCGLRPGHGHATGVSGRSID